MWRSEDEHSDAWWHTASSSGWWTTSGSGTEEYWNKSRRRVVSVFYTKDSREQRVKRWQRPREEAAAVARRGTENASATVATRKQVQEALQRKKEHKTEEQCSVHSQSRQRRMNKRK